MFKNINKMVHYIYNIKHVLFDLHISFTIKDNN